MIINMFNAINCYALHETKTTDLTLSSFFQIDLKPFEQLKFVK